MADDQSATTEDDDAEPTSKGPGLIVWALLGLLSAVAGFVVPFLLPSGEASDADAAATSSDPAIPLADDVVFLPVEEVIVNLDEGRLNRFLRLRVNLQVAKADEESITKLLEQRKAVLKNWLLSHLSDKGMDDIRGAAGQNRLRREIQDQFNTILFPDGYDRINDVLFEEFNVQ